MANSKKCKHSACSCMAREGSDYCSQYCEDSKGTTSLNCHCPHDGCSGHV